MGLSVMRDLMATLIGFNGATASFEIVIEALCGRVKSGSVEQPQTRNKRIKVNVSVTGQWSEVVAERVVI